MLLLYFLCFAIVARAASIVQQADTCPLNVLSCELGSGDSCCSPNNGLVVLSQQWEYAGPRNAWTLHGLWPNQCDGTFTDRGGCRDHSQYDEDGVEMTRVVSRNATLHRQMIKYWPSNKGPQNNGWFWNHEWVTHGTCLSTMDPQCYSGAVGHQDVYDYFATALGLREKYDLFTILQKYDIVPGYEYDVSEFINAIQDELHVTPLLTCRGDSLIDFMLYFKVQNGDDYVPVDMVENPDPPPRMNQPCTGYIKYFTK